MVRVTSINILKNSRAGRGHRLHAPSSGSGWPGPTGIFRRSFQRRFLELGTVSSILFLLGHPTPPGSIIRPVIGVHDTGAKTGSRRWLTVNMHGDRYLGEIDDE